MLKRHAAVFVVPGAFVALALLLLVPSTAGAATSHPAPPGGTCQPFTRFAATDFGRSTRIDNAFLPLKPGTQLTLEGRSNRNGARLPHTVSFTVTDLVKKIDG